MSLIPASELSSSPEKGRVLDMLFEPCDVLREFLISALLSHNEKYDSYDQFIETARKSLLDFLLSAELEASSGKPLDPRISKIIAAHPRLGAPKPSQPGEKLSEHSAAEQKSLADAAEQLGYWNEKYEETFPGLRYVVFVNGRSRDVIMKNMKVRIERGDIKKERVEAFNAMCDIAHDRASKAKL
ncbi:hypothetical protein PGUG_00564 [Meyerozyma guilliermondii ATCC 6260]|uniref:Oxo-4-hydroxy-4-carboxy-5-ureidoimidazoline decarboxylase domain-containing protein n=1 Tax=Meyerozyma guilliermondii (strain ATCC 6260 / CBS 566 / DSM 6381 / JCM 1539 / NBRC 10279 / NRRL Y-324) TaxID=294746 RepID=A5DBA9_PICGU|nr:uncharacterized protein PGUG_00564 [Meyerozyma guilliermondii ATCC 6260]EDK36466.2 hypothetical protein PGUG_00564 [Meyerozyma guilliermondii ATCC 6260]